VTAANHPMAWADQGACVGMDTSLFYIESSEQIAPEVEAACHRCPVFVDCHTWALRHEAFGYWAGTSERQRRRLRRALPTPPPRPPQPRRPDGAVDIRALCAQLDAEANVGAGKPRKP